MSRILSNLRGPLEVIRRVRKRAAPITMVFLGAALACKYWYWDRARIPHKLLAESAKFVGATFYVNTLKTADPHWKGTSLLQLRQMCQYQYWVEELGKNTNLLSYLVRNLDKLGDSETDKKACLEIIFQLSQNVTNIDRLLLEVPPALLVNILNNSKVDLFSSHVAHILYTSPVMNEDFKKAFKSSSSYHHRRIVHANAKYAKILNLHKDEKKKEFPSIKYICALWFVRLFVFQRYHHLPSVNPIVFAGAPLIAWSYGGYFLSTQIQKSLRKQEKEIMDPATKGSYAHKKFLLDKYAVFSSMQMLFFAFCFPFSLVPQLVNQNMTVIETLQQKTSQFFEISTLVKQN